MGQASLDEVIPSENEIKVFMNTNNCSHGDSPMNLSFTFADCFCPKFYYGCPTASADCVTDEDKGYSLSNGATFGSIGGRTTLAFDLTSTPSAGWTMPS